MAGGKSSSNASRLRKRVEADSSSSSSSALKRAKDGSAFAKCEECNKDVPVALISFHNCSLDAKIKMNLETQVVETPSEPKKKPAVEKKKVKETEPKAKKEKKGKNPNAPKRPPTAFFLFMEDFRKTFKEANPECNKVSTVAKNGGEKWKSMTDEEKKVYIDRAAERKAKYEMALNEQNEESNDAESEQNEESNNAENEQNEESNNAENEQTEQPNDVEDKQNEQDDDDTLKKEVKEEIKVEDE